jgi:hypothetical protein
MGFTLSDRSLSFVTHVDPRLVAVAKLAITLSDQDFGFTDAQSRTPAEEAALVARGVSHTMKSHHIIDCRPGWAAPGCSGALDAVPWDGAAYVWEWPRVYKVAAAFRAASDRLATPITWGGVWDRLMSEYSATPDEIAAEAAAYATRQRAIGVRRVLLDGPHFELGRN